MPSIKKFKQPILRLLNWSEKYTATNMTYVVGGGSWLIAGKIALAGISFVLTLAFANWLPRETYGKYQFLIAIISMLGIFTLPGIHTSLVKTIAQGKEGTLALAVREKIKYGLIASFFALGISGWYFMRENPLLGWSFLISALFLPVLETFHIFLQFWNGRKRFDLQTKYEVLSSFFSTLVLIATIYITNNLIAVITAFLIGHTLFDWLLYQKTLRQTINKEEDRQAISFGKHLTIMNAFTVIATHIDKVLIWKFLGAAEVAIYTFALLPIQKIIGTIPIVPLALPRLGELNIKEKKANIFKKFLKLFFIFIPLALLLVSLAPLIYKLLFLQYTKSVVYFQGLSLMIVMLPFSLLSAALVADLRRKELYIINTAPPVLKLVLLVSLTPFYGIFGVVATLVITQIVISSLILFYFRKL